MDGKARIVAFVRVEWRNSGSCVRSIVVREFLKVIRNVGRAIPRDGITLNPRAKP